MRKLQNILLFGLATIGAVGCASANSITYFSNGNFTVANGTNCAAGCTFAYAGGTVTVNNASGVAPDGASDTASISVVNSNGMALITFENFNDPQTANLNSTPNNINFDYFHTYGDLAGDTFQFPSFTFQLVTTDQSENGVPVGSSVNFTGLANAGSLSGSGLVTASGASNVNIAGSSTIDVLWQSPLSQNVTASTVFQINAETDLVSPSTLQGESTVQGKVFSSTPEPGSMFLLGSGLLAAGFVSRRRFFGSR